ncbi:MAG: hypothetical protein JST06_02740 [Bacteroidetes bacterium]|nr:hypothetical protein [Bacteroidota bacterium]MBS1630687.1 hypothetical protein [Bacteroidota bacterium]
MKATIGIYETQEKAIGAIKALKDAGYSEKKISILHRAADAPDPKDPGEGGQGLGRDSDDVYSKDMKAAATGVGIGAVVGPTLGILAGVGIISIPGLGILVGAGAVAGALAGLDVGLIGGGIISSLAIARMNKHHEALYHEHLEAGRFIVIAHGNDDEIEQAKDILEKYGEHVDIASHA